MKDAADRARATLNLLLILGLALVWMALRHDTKVDESIAQLIRLSEKFDLRTSLSSAIEEHSASLEDHLGHFKRTREKVTNDVYYQYPCAALQIQTDDPEVSRGLTLPFRDFMSRDADLHRRFVERETVFQRNLNALRTGGDDASTWGVFITLHSIAKRACTESRILGVLDDLRIEVLRAQELESLPIELIQERLRGRVSIPQIKDPLPIDSALVLLVLAVCSSLTILRGTIGEITARADRAEEAFAWIGFHTSTLSFFILAAWVLLPAVLLVFLTANYGFLLLGGLLSLLLAALVVRRLVALRSFLRSVASM